MALSLVAALAACTGGGPPSASAPPNPGVNASPEFTLYPTPPPYGYPPQASGTPYLTPAPSTPPPVAVTPPAPSTPPPTATPACQTPPPGPGGSLIRVARRGSSGAGGGVLAFSGCLLPIVPQPSFGKNDLSGMCIDVIKNLMTFTLYWYGTALDGMVVKIKGVNGGEPWFVIFDPSGPGFVTPVGKVEVGADEIESIIGVTPTGEQLDMTKLITDFLHTTVLNIPANGNASFGSICQH